ncbi:hypothetical protein GGF46_002617 [Coemansia sp. RSA 552]|nr:hypothetical protein GGF46_002617 [Coemansia sp. RSA 552]
MKDPGAEPPLFYPGRSLSASGRDQPWRARTWLLYAADWITIITTVAISQVILIPQPFAVQFLPADPGIQQRYTKDEFDITRSSIVLCTAIPIIIVILWLGYFRRPFSDIHQAVLGLGMALSLCVLFTSIFKQLSLILSSDFMDRCKPAPAALERALRAGTPLSYHDCTGPTTQSGLRFYPAFTVTVPSCSMAYLSLFASLQLGLWLHPQVRRQLRETAAPGCGLGLRRPGQMLISFVSLLPVAAGMTFPAMEAKYHGGGNGWGIACSILVGFFFALWAHIIYCSDMPSALAWYIYA